MTTSALKSLLKLKEMPFPSLLLITDKVHCASAFPIAKVMLDKLIAERRYSIHCVHGSIFAEQLSSSDEVAHYHPTFIEYGEDPTAFDYFMSAYKNARPQKTQNITQHLSEVSSKATESHGNTSEMNSTSSALGLENQNVNENPEDSLKTLVVVDRVEDILLSSTISSVMQSCQEVIEDGGTVILVCSSCLVEPSELEYMKYKASASASAIVELTSAEGSPQSSHWLGIADVTIHRPTGKIIESREYYHIDSELHTISTAVAPPLSTHSFAPVPAVQLSTKESTSANKSSFTRNPALENRSEILGGGKGAPKISLKATSSDTDFGSDASRLAKSCDGADEGSREQQAINSLLSQATFNLKISDEEKKAKNNLLLPHQRVQQSGVVHYTPDSEDWDEEDPDDDLDI